MTSTTLPQVAVDPVLAKRLARVADRHRKDEQERDELIAQAVAEGGKLREVAALVGLSHVAVMKIANRTKSQPES